MTILRLVASLKNGLIMLYIIGKIFGAGNKQIANTYDEQKIVVQSTSNCWVKLTNKNMILCQKMLKKNFTTRISNKSVTVILTIWTQFKRVITLPCEVFGNISTHVGQCVSYVVLWQRQWLSTEEVVSSTSSHSTAG